MTPYLFVVAFLIFILGTAGTVTTTIIYERFLKKYNIFINPKINRIFKNQKLLKITELILDSKPKKMLSNTCFIFGLLSIVTSAFLMLFIGFENSQTRDLGLFVGLWASTLFGLANFLKH